MKPVSFRVGLLAGLLSQFHGGSFVGVMVTASHNPSEDNGVKLIDPNGEMVTGVWEDVATELANTSDADLSTVLADICAKMTINKEFDVKVAVGRDTRPSGIELCEAIELGVKNIQSTATFINLQLQTTPQCHFSILELNKTSGSERDGYIEHFSDKFEKLLLLGDRKLKSGLVIDAANGIGSHSAKAFRDRLQKTTGFDPLIINTGNEFGDILNHDCGADFVKIQMIPPKGVEKKDKDNNTQDNNDNNNWRRYASLDGDADRLIYFYFNETGEFKMLDGDRISVLFAFYLRKLLKSAGLFDSLKFGVVQTAYANGVSTNFLRSQNILVSMACTGVKNLHHVASEQYDIGVYFEANGHGTILFSPRACSAIAASSSEKLKLVKELVNQCVGDAMSDLLFVEAILCQEEMSLSQWDALYNELPSRQLKVKVSDRSVFKTTAADTKLTHPSHLQDQIDLLIRQIPNGRAFVRPSGTEDVVRVYAEAETRQECDNLAQSIANLIK